MSDMVQLQISTVELKYLRAFLRLQNVELMAAEVTLAPRTVRAYLHMIDERLQCAGCFE